MAKFTILLALVALFALTAAVPQVNVADNSGPGGVNVVDGAPPPDQVQVVDGDHQVNFDDGSQGQARGGP